MTTNKDFKRLVRSRMVKTGESYTSARAVLLRSKGVRGGQGGQTAIGADRPDHLVRPVAFAERAGLMSDAKIKAATGCDWQSWVKALDYAKAHTWPHREIAQYVREKFKTPSWWTQAVTVGYERIKGLRAIGQRRDGGYEANKSKTFAAPIGKVYRAFNDKRGRKAWLPGVDLTIRTKTREKSMRIHWPDGTSVMVGFIGKGDGKSQVAIQHGKLPDKATADRTKEFWGERLKVLGEVLAG